MEQTRKQTTRLRETPEHVLNAHCACLVTRHLKAREQAYYHIQFCPMHAQAPAMREALQCVDHALEALLALHSQLHCNGKPDCGLDAMVEAGLHARALLSQVKGEK